MSHKKTDLGIPRSLNSAKVVLVGQVPATNEPYASDSERRQPWRVGRLRSLLRTCHADDLSKRVTPKSGRLFRTLRVCGAMRAGLFIALIAAAWLGGQVQDSVAQTRPSASPSEPEKASARKESAPRKETRRIADPYTVGFVTGTPQCTEFTIAQDIATTLASGQETGPHGEVALRVVPIVGN